MANKATDYSEINYTEKVLERCEKQGDCQIWQGAKHRQNYGMMRYWGTMKTTHQIIGIEKYGHPDNTGVHKFTQTCGNTLCCNPDHIVQVTHSQVMTSFVKTRKPKRGARAELSREQVVEIRNYPDEGWGTNEKLARRFKVNSSSIGKIRRGETYQWIQ